MKNNRKVLRAKKKPFNNSCMYFMLKRKTKTKNLVKNKKKIYLISI